MPHFDIVCVGNAKIDTFLTLHQANKHLRLLEETRELCVKFGEKISVDKAEILLGGNAANVSIGTSRLGLNTAIIAEVGDDEFAQKILNTFKNERVNTSKVKQTQNQQSSFSTIINYKGERTIFSEHVKRLHDFNFDNITAPWVYLTSLGEEWTNAYDKTISFVKDKQCLLAFNPGTLQIGSGIKGIEKVLLNTNVLFVNKQEGEELLGYSQEEKSFEEIISNLKKLGPKIVVVTDGKNGSFAMNEKSEFFSQPIISAPVVEKTGAGDAYSSGFISALINNKSIAEAMEWGTKNSASVIGKVGASAGLLGKTGIENYK